MKLWISKSTEVPMKEQLVTQITLGITSGDLEIGEKLPSRQEISRRFKIHANTVSNAYQELRVRGWIEFRPGSGFYVNEFDSDDLGEKTGLDTLITKFLQTAQSFGFSTEEIRETLKKRLESKSPASLLVIESDKPLREILVEEIKRETSVDVYGISLEEFENEHREINSNFVALSDEQKKIDPILDADETCVYLKSGSVPEAMKDETRPAEDSLIAVVSGWKPFLLMAKTILVAAKIDGDSIITRSTDEANWKRGIDAASVIICDSLTSKEFPDNPKLKTFQFISDESINEIHRVTNYAETRTK